MDTRDQKLKICYFGNYVSDFSRNRIFQSGLKQNGAQVVECQDMSRGLTKYYRLWKKHQKIKNDYDVMIVGYPGHVVAPFAKLISSKKVVLDALCSLYEGEIISRQSSRRWSIKGLQIWLIDFLAYFFVDLVLVESEAQKKFFIKRFFVSPNKCQVVYTGADDSVFFPDPNIKKKKTFTAVFRGRFLPEAGVDVVVRAAKLLEGKGIDFLIIGGGLENKKILKLISDLKPSNLFLESRRLSDGELRAEMLSCHVSLGQFANHERLSRTIPHKAFESLALGLPYLTARSEGVSEMLTDEQNCVMTEANDPESLSNKIVFLRDNYVTNEIAQRGFVLYQNNFSPLKLGERIVGLLRLLG